MSTLKVTALKNPSSSANNIVLNTDGSISGSLVIDDGGGVGPTVDIKGGGTSTDSPAANEQTLFLRTRDGTTSLSTGIGLWGTFENFPSDTGARRAADIRAGFNGGTWGNEYISFHVGVGTGVVSNDSAAMTTERLRLTKTTMTANVDIEDTVGSVRTPRRIVISTATTIADEGVYYCISNPTVTLGAPAGGTVMTLYNNSGSAMTLNRGSTLSNMRIAADNNTTNKTSVTLGAYSTTTITIFEPSALAIVTGTDVT